jgi:uroporphyrinogen decarboxylase
MTRKERIIQTINHIQTDYIPYQIDFTAQEYEKVAKYLGDKSFGEKIGNHISSVRYDGWPKEIAPGSGYFRDDFGVLWNRNGADKDIGFIDGYVITEPDITTYRFPLPDEKTFRSMLEKTVKESKDRFITVNMGFSMFERSWTLRGMENLLVDMITEPDFVDQLMDAIAAYNVHMMDIALEYDIDGFLFGDDWGQQKGLIMGPDYWRRFIRPGMAKMYEKAKSKGKYVFQHSCGDISEIFPDLIDMGLDAYQTFQPEIYDIQKVKTEYGSRLTFFGGISTQRLLPFASPDKVREVTRKTLDIMGKGGGYIAAPTHDIPGDVPPQNVIAMLDVLENQ